jgi:hypothetical protein
MELPPKRYILEKMLAKLWQNNQLRPGLKEGEDFIIVDETVFNFLKARYHCKEGHEIVRYGILVNPDTEESIVELYFKQIDYYPVPNSLLNFKAPKSLLISRKETVGDLIKKIQRALNNRLLELKERSFMVSNMRIWKSNSNSLEELEGLTKKHKNYTAVKVDGRCLSPKPEDLATAVEDLDLAQEDIIIAELPKGKDQWTLVPLDAEA